jgi:hypothetical protein
MLVFKQLFTLFKALVLLFGNKITQHGIEQNVLYTNSGKQQSVAATVV